MYGLIALEVERMPPRERITVSTVSEQLTRHVTDCMEERKATTLALEALKIEIIKATTMATLTKNTVQNYEHVFDQINKSLRWLIRAVLVAALSTGASVAGQEYIRHKENSVVRRENIQDQSRMASVIVNAVKDKK